MNRIRRGALAAAGLALILPTGAGGQAPPSITLESPVACKVGETCFIQQFMDDDPGPGAKDFRCGARTYDGHEGFDVRLPSMAAMRAGSNVLASAAGTVFGTRDGMVDSDQPGGDDITDRECGNGVVIDHPGGWQSQYCHMARGSVRVKAGQAVAAGAVLGQIGMSGAADFPHVHMTLRLNGRDIDPFAFGAAPGACGAGRSLFSAAAQTTLTYRDTELIGIGFASIVPTGARIIDGYGPNPPPTRRSETVVFYAHAVGLKDGDVITLDLKGPEGQTLCRSAPAPLTGGQADWLRFTACGRSGETWPAGRYLGEYKVWRGGAEIISRQAPLDL